MLSVFVLPKPTGRLKKTIVSWKNAINMIGKQRENTFLTSRVADGDPAVCTVGDEGGNEGVYFGKVLQ
jgi:hypothetical protein